MCREMKKDSPTTAFKVAEVISYELEMKISESMIRRALHSHGYFCRAPPKVAFP